MRRGIAPALIVIAVAALFFAAVVVPNVSKEGKIFRPTILPTILPSLIPSILPSLIPTIFPTSTPAEASSDLKNFKSEQEIKLFLESSSYGGYGGFGGVLGAISASLPMMAVSSRSSAPLPQATPATSESVDSGGRGADYSTTNVQVLGVDEVDVVKNDGKYLYAISNSRIFILDAFPAAGAKIVSQLDDSRYANIFVNGDKLVAFGNGEFEWKKILPSPEPVPQSDKEKASTSSQKKISFSAVLPPDYYPYWREQSSFIKVFDVSDRSAPRLLKRFDFKGNYVQARMIGERVYAIYSEYADYRLPYPVYAVDSALASIAPTEIGYFDYPDSNYQFTTVVGFDVDDLSKDAARKVVLMGGSQNIFVSQQNAFITYASYSRQYVDPWSDWLFQEIEKMLSLEVKEKLDAIASSGVADWRKQNLERKTVLEYYQSLDENKRQEISKRFSEKQLEDAKKEKEKSEEQKLKEFEEKISESRERTAIHKFSLGEQIEYRGKGEVPGHALNQFSMDEFDGFFRIATTVGEVWRSAGEGQKPAVNNLYVLDSNLKLAGSLEDLAPGEKIYSARFMGKKAYLVTFKKVDPLFVIGLDDPRAPKLLGKLKIPGYSDYLHPFGENHLIGLGKDAVPAEEGDFAWYQGVKLSLFDVSDVENPKETASFKVGDRGTESYALQDHKAFLFSAKRNLLVIPIRLAEINREKYPPGQEPEPTASGEFTFQGAYVFRVTTEDGFQLRGRISHADEEALRKSGEYYYGGGTDVKRSAYIENSLYTISDKFVKANEFNSLEEQASVAIPVAQPRQYGEYYE